MDKVTGISVLRQALALPQVSRSSIGRALGIDASQVSRIAAGRFVKLDGHALRVCKYAQGLLLPDSNPPANNAAALEAKLSRLSAINPRALVAISQLVDALLAQPGEREGDSTAPASGAHQ